MAPGGLAPLAGILLHERWFVSSEGLPTDWAAILEPGPALAVGAAVAITLAAYLLWRTRGRTPVIPGPLRLGATPERLAVALGWIPMLLAVHTAVPLMVSGIQGELFVPNLEMELPASAVVGLLEVGIAILLFYGLLARVAAVLLAVLWLLGAILFGPVLLLEHAIFLGIAAFFWVAGRGPVALDRLFGPWAGAREELLPRAIPILRVATGFSLAWLALTEKLLNLPLALRFLEAYPFVNFLPELGLAVSDRTFFLAAGTVELTAGLLLMTGAFPRLVILVLWLPFNLTLAVFGWQEFVGHLPVYGAMLVILLWGSGGEEDHEALRAGLIPLREKPVGEGVQRSGRPSPH